MAPKPRDVFKTRAARIGEVFTLLHLKTGQANSQLVAFGGDLTFTTFTLNISQTCAVLGQAIIDKAASSVATTVAVSTGAAQFMKAVIEMDASGVITIRAGVIAASQLLAVRPTDDPTKIILGHIEIPASFTGGTTTLSQPMLIKEAYWT
jgi:hypothetical protein